MKARPLVFIFGLLLCSIASSSTFAQQTDPDSEIVFETGSLIVIRMDGACGLALNSFHPELGETDSLLVYDAADRMVSFAITSTITTSLPDQAETILDLHFVGDDDRFMNWSDQAFAYERNEDVYTFSAHYTGQDGQLFLDDFAAYRFLGVTFRGEIFVGARLTNTAMGVRHLRACAFEEGGINPHDPFAR